MVTPNDGRNVIAAAEKKALDIRQPMNIAVADAAKSRERLAEARALGKIVLMVRNAPTLS